MKRRTTAFMLALVISLSALFAGVPTREETQWRSSGSPKSTTITPYMEQKIDPGSNLVFCSVFQIAWNMLQDSIVGEEIRLEGDPLTARMLNRQRSTAHDLSEDCYLVVAGELTQELLDRLNRNLTRKFGDDSPPAVTEPMPSDEAILSYAYLYKDLRFEHKFESLEGPIRFQWGDNATPVSAFGIGACSETNRELGQQVQVSEFVPGSIYGSTAQSFIIRLESKSADDEIVLACVQPEATLLKTIETVSRKVEQASPSRLETGDVLQIPRLEFDLDHSFRELIGLHLLNQGWEKWFVARATQYIGFKLNEKGSVVKSEGRIVVKKGPAPRRFVFDRPFLIYLKQKGAEYPYLAVWVGNSELLMKQGM